MMELREELMEDLQGDCMEDIITKKEMMEILDDFDDWAETAKDGDVYICNERYYECELNDSYEVAVWQNGEVRDIGEAIFMTPISSTTDLEAIKKEVESYDIGATGCIEIFSDESGDAILHYEKGLWTNC